MVCRGLLGWCCLYGAVAMVSGNIVITEIMRNPSQASDANGEWFELYNTLNRGQNLRNWVVRDEEGDRFVIDRNLIIPARGYVVLGNNNNTRLNGGVILNYVYDRTQFTLRRNDQMSLFNANNRRIDRVNWGAGGFPGQPGRTIELRDVALDNNFGPNWCLASKRFGAGDRGTPGAANDCPPLVRPPRATAAAAPRGAAPRAAAAPAPRAAPRSAAVTAPQMAPAVMTMPTMSEAPYPSE
jgi:Lamin Tail Domain